MNWYVLLIGAVAVERLAELVVGLGQAERLRVARVQLHQPVKELVAFVERAHAHALQGAC